MNVLVVLCTCPTIHVAKRLSRSVVEGRLAACVTILPAAESIYLWEGKLKVETEVQLLIKATSDTFPLLEKVLTDQHPYDNPEILALPVTAAAAPFAQWISDQCQLPQPE